MSSAKARHVTQSSSSLSSPTTTTTSGSHSIVLVVLFGILLSCAPLLDRKMKQLQSFLGQEFLKQKFSITIKNNFLQDPLLTKVQNETLWRACDKITSTGSVRFWYYPSEEPNNIFEEIAVAIYKDTPYWDEAVSYEYWCNIIEERDNDNQDTKYTDHSSSREQNNLMEHPWHTDRDEDVLLKEDKFINPLMGAVYYGFNTTFVGGDFHMIDSIPYKIGTHPWNPKDDCNVKHGTCITNPHLFTSTKHDEALFVPTYFNMLLMANVTHFHKVTKVLKGSRYALAVNADHWKPYEVKRAPNNDEMIALANNGLELNRRDFGL